MQTVPFRCLWMLRFFCLIALILAVSGSVSGQSTPDPTRLLAEAERLAWFKSWAKAEPLYAEAERLFAARGDERNALFARVGRMRGELPRRPVAQVSQGLDDILASPIAESDDRLRLRCLTIKGETEEDFDPELAEASWSEALQIAERLGEKQWANRAKGELGVVAALKGDMNAAIMQLGTALAAAEASGDVPSLVRWLTIFGHGFVQFGRPEQALVYYDKAMQTAAASGEMGMPVMTYLGKGEALASVGRFAEAEKMLGVALSVAVETGSLGYQAELNMKLGLIAGKQGKQREAVGLLEQAADLAGKAGGDRLIAEARLELARLQRAAKQREAAHRSLADGASFARKLNEPFLLPKILGEQADLFLEQRRIAEARDALDEATDLLESLLAKTSSPWLKSRVFGVMDQVFLARLDLEGADLHAGRMFGVIEHARGRVLADMLLSRSNSQSQRSPVLIAGEKRLASLQAKLYDASSAKMRKALLDEIFLAESRMAPEATRLFHAEMVDRARKPALLREVQELMTPDEVILEFAVTKKALYCIEITSESARVRHVGTAVEFTKMASALSTAIRKETDLEPHATALGRLLIAQSTMVRSKKRIIVVPDGPLHQIPFDVLRFADGKSLLVTHVISYSPSASVLSLIRRRPISRALPRLALAVAASPDEVESQLISDAAHAPIGQLGRGVFDLEGSSLPSLPAAADEARSVVSLLDGSPQDAIVGTAATESNVKRLPLADYRILHFATHGIVSTKFPERSALLLRKGDGDDGLLQAREILRLNLRSDLVTLSACDTGSGNKFGQEGVSNLVRPVLAAGSRSVLASLWGADDTFSLALMKAFYRNLATGDDAGEALRKAKLTMLQRFGPKATPRLWSGYLLYGDSTVTLPRVRSAAGKGAAR